MLSLGQSCVICSKQHPVTIFHFPGSLLNFTDFKLNLALHYRQIFSSFGLLFKIGKLSGVRPKLGKCLDAYFLPNVYRSFLVLVQGAYEQNGLEPKNKYKHLSTFFCLMYGVYSLILIKLLLPIWCLKFILREWICSSKRNVLLEGCLGFRFGVFFSLKVCNKFTHILFLWEFLKICIWLFWLLF